MEKECIKCGETKPLSAFYKHKQMKDGHLNKCKSCCKSEAKEKERENRENPDWVKKQRKRGREKYHRLNYRDKYKPSPEDKKKAIQRYKKKYPEKVAARNKTSHMKPEVKGNHLHHWSYNEEHFKDVIELSEKDHNTVHTFMVYNQKKKMYETLNGVLLDTREKHEKYINQFF